MKSEITTLPKQKQTINYPVLAKYIGEGRKYPHVVLFVSSGQGFVVHLGKETEFKIGSSEKWLDLEGYSAQWEILPPEVKIILSNE